MKKIIFALTFGLLTIVANAQEEEVDNAKASVKALANIEEKNETTNNDENINLAWEKSFKNAITKAKKKKKLIFILFTGSDWCLPCKKLEKNVLKTQKFKDYADKYFILYKADFPRNKDLIKKQNRNYNKSLQKRFKQRSFPTIIVIDDNGNAFGKREGIYTWDSYYKFFEEMVLNLKAKKKKKKKK